MEILHEVKDLNKKTFLSHVFDTREEGKAEILNIIQYSLIAVIPVVLLNKTIQRFIPEADSEKSSLELLAEIFIQIVVMFCGIIVIHRIITYIPTYSGFKYESLALTNVIIAFLVIVLSIQTKLGMKVNELWDRVIELWNGSDSNSKKDKVKNVVRVNKGQSAHTPSRADYVDNSAVQGGTFPPAPVATTRQPANDMYDNMMGGSASQNQYGLLSGPVPASSLLGSMGSLF